ncbi:TetR/AcrR family transcriptional regulator [Rhodococcus sp. NPDC057529]|uniref:TetR/AcrR family transcriptional regulator n=1 Tax=Rhodococcus sp. NPDC057529 TaxID=3346158 RepID=UPI00366B48D8
MADQGPSARKPRKDVLRNRAEILNVALRHFTDQGIGASLEAIAGEAGVGPATLYRHFPSREALLAAALAAREEELRTRRVEIERIADPDEALRQWLRALEDYLSLFNGLPDPVVKALKEPDSPLAASCDKLIEDTDRILATAQRDGTARDTVHADTLFLAALSLAWVKGARNTDDTRMQTLRVMMATGYMGGPALELENEKSRHTRHQGG